MVNTGNECQFSKPFCESPSFFEKKLFPYRHLFLQDLCSISFFVSLCLLFFSIFFFRTRQIDHFFCGRKTTCLIFPRTYFLNFCYSISDKIKKVLSSFVDFFFFSKSFFKKNLSLLNFSDSFFRFHFVVVFEHISVSPAVPEKFVYFFLKIFCRKNLLQENCVQLPENNFCE